MNRKLPHNTAISSFRQEKIEDCLMENMCSAHYDSISVTDMCRQMGISRQLFYTYFPDKEACLIALIDRIVAESIDACLNASSSGSANRDEIVRYLRYWRSRAKFLDIIAKNRLEGLLIDRCHVYFQGHRSLVMPHLSTPELEADDTILGFYVAVRLIAVFQWYRDRFAMSVEEMAVRYERMLKEPLLQNLP